MKTKLIVLISFLLFQVTVGYSQPTVHEDLALKYIVELPAESAAQIPVVILLHGYGSDENDLFSLKTIFPKSWLVISVRAPYALPGAGYEWYEMVTINGQRDGRGDQLDASRNAIKTFIKQVVRKYKADSSQVYLIGFSQGAIMSYETGLTDAAEVRGIGILSGMVLPSLKRQVINSEALKRLRIFISHGTTDDRISYDLGKKSYDYLTNMGLKPEFHEYKGMGHQISGDVVKDLVKWFPAR